MLLQHFVAVSVNIFVDDARLDLALDEKPKVIWATCASSGLITCQKCANAKSMLGSMDDTLSSCIDHYSYTTWLGNYRGLLCFAYCGYFYPGHRIASHHHMPWFWHIELKLDVKGFIGGEVLGRVSLRIYRSKSDKCCRPVNKIRHAISRFLA
jgi:hypothetical protein